MEEPLGTGLSVGLAETGILFSLRSVQTIYVYDGHQWGKLVMDCATALLRYCAIALVRPSTKYK
jgi:hypothetical protein